MKSRVFIVLGLLFYVQSAKHRPSPKPAIAKPKSPAVKKAYLSCAEDTKVEPELVLELKSGNWKEDEKLKKWVHCVLVKSELMTNQSVFQLDVALANFKENEESKRKEYEGNIDKCLPTKALKPREIAWRFAKCYDVLAPQYSLF